MKAIGESTGRSLATIKQDQKEIGDLGLVAVKSRSKQPTMIKPKPLTVAGVHKSLIAIATVTGNGAQGRKVDGIKKLLSAADSQAAVKVDITKDKGGPSEAKFIIRFLEGKLRLGLAEKTVLISLAQAIIAHEAGVKGKTAGPSDVDKAEAQLTNACRPASAIAFWVGPSGTACCRTGLSSSARAATAPPPSALKAVPQARKPSLPVARARQAVKAGSAPRTMRAASSSGTLPLAAARSSAWP